ncbi:hypothetical protein [Marinicellulosiphila megalodicopiae]|uniref:hypothetical protein n=1 Tax=Marinicellulosiphila megalodicopiae TaxID=2724896 RepID=UPI003BB06190
MKKALVIASLLASISGFTQAEGADPIEARTFFEVEAGLASLNQTQATTEGFDSNAISVSGSAGIILGYFRGGIGAIGILPNDSDIGNLFDDEGYVVANPSIAFAGFNAFAGGRYAYLDKYEFNFDVGLSTMSHFQQGNDVNIQQSSLESNGGLFIRPSFNYYITSFFGIHASYQQMIGSETTLKSTFSAGTVFKL